MIGVRGDEAKIVAIGIMVVKIIVPETFMLKLVSFQ
jgi:hypothetical protein